MQIVLEKIIESLNNGNILVAVLIAFIALIFNYKKLVHFFDERKKTRVLVLTETLECQYINGLTKSHIEDELATEQFKLATGIRLEKEFREAVIQAHQKTNGELSFPHFKRALPYLFYEKSALKIKISKFEIIGFWFNYLSGFVLALIGLIFLVLPNLIKGIQMSQTFNLLGLGIFFITIALFSLYQTFPIKSARYISSELDKHRAPRDESRC